MVYKLLLMSANFGAQELHDSADEPRESSSDIHLTTYAVSTQVA